MLACRAFGENRARLAKAMTPEEKGENTRPVERERRIVAGNGGAEQREKIIQGIWRETGTKPANEDTAGVKIPRWKDKQ